MLIPILQLLLSVLLLEISSGLQGVLVPVWAQFEGFDTMAIGTLGSVYYIGFILGCLLVPRLMHRVGHIRTFTGLASVMSAVLLLHPLFIQSTAWILMRILIGFGYAGLYVVIESWLNSHVSNATRGRVFAIYMVATWCALVAGKLAFGLWQIQSFPPFVVAGVLACLSIAPVAFITMAEPVRPPVTVVKIRWVFALSL